MRLPRARIFPIRSLQIKMHRILRTLVPTMQPAQRPMASIYSHRRIRSSPNEKKPRHAPTARQGHPRMVEEERNGNHMILRVRHLPPPLARLLSRPPLRQSGRGQIPSTASVPMDTVRSLAKRTTMTTTTTKSCCTKGRNQRLERVGSRRSQRQRRRSEETSWSATAKVYRGPHCCSGHTKSHAAALKCRQRKKAWLASLQAKVEYLTTENERLSSALVSSREEIARLSALVGGAVIGPGGPPVAPGVVPSSAVVSNGQPVSMNMNVAAKSGAATARASYGY